MDVNSTTHGPALPSPGERQGLVRYGLATGWLLAMAAATGVGHLLVAGNYGYFRDELYYLADGHHLQAGYVDQPLLMGWLAALLRVTVGNGLVAIHVVPALACAGLVVITGSLARELGGGRTAQIVAGAAALFCVGFMATGSLFSMDVLDQVWWALGSLLLARLLRHDDPRLWLLFGAVMAVALLTKLTVLFFGLAVALALLISAERRWLRTRWPWLAVGIAGLGVVPYAAWNVLNGWPTLDFYRHYGGVGASPTEFLAGQVGQLNPANLVLVGAGAAFYLGRAGAPFRLLGLTVAVLLVMLTALGVKAYVLAPAYPIVFAAGAVVVERLDARPRLRWVRWTYLALAGVIGLALAPAVVPILPPATLAATYGQVPVWLGDRLGWDELTRTTERVYAALPAEQRAQACVATSNYGQASALSLLAGPGALPHVISGHNNYALWGPGSCSGAVIIAVGFDPASVEASYGQAALAVVQHCPYCNPIEQDVPIYVLTEPRFSSIAGLWQQTRHFD